MKKYLLIILLFGAIQSNAQHSGEEKLGSWLMYFGNTKISDKYSLHTEAQLRLYEPVNNFNQLLLRTGLNYHINSYALVTLGYGYIPTETYDKERPDAQSIEHRIWQQFILTNSIGRFHFEHRYRIEQRWINSEETTRYLDRLRYRLMVNIPLNKAEMLENTVFLSFYDEVFLNVTDTPFDQNRLYGALGYKFSKAISLQAGYLRHRLGPNNYNRLQLAFFINSDLTKAFSSSL